jgi:N-acetylglucosamine-6-phosphate deacetylase
MASALETIEQAVCTSSAVVALHFEGPAISSARLGVHDGAYRSDTFPVGLIPPGASAPVIVTVAPEVVGQHGVAELSRKGVKVALGHSNATLGEFEAGVEAGGRLVTHLYNAMRPFSGRDPGIIGGALTDDRVWVDVIPDGFHVDFASVRLAWKAKPKGRCFFVTDAMPPVGSTMSSYRLGDLEIFYNGDCCVTKDGVIAGSGLNLARGVKNAVARVGIPKDEALKMASLYPAEYLGIADRLGRVRTGCLANLVVIDNECNVMRVYFEGMEIDDSGRAA